MRLIYGVQADQGHPLPNIALRRMQAGEPVLLICHAFPPIFDIGGRRWAKFAKELARRGHPVHVIRAEKLPGTPDSLWNTDGSWPGIIHHPLPRRYPAVLMQQQVRSLKDKLLYRFWMHALPMLCKGNWYDHAVLWRKQLIREASKLIRAHGVRQVIVTGFPFHLMDHALTLKQLFPELHLTMDFRDEWTWTGHYGLSSISARRLQQEKDMEARVVQGASVVTTPAKKMVEHLQSVYRGDARKILVLPHAVDPDDFDLSIPPQQDGIFRMVYAGSLYGAAEAQQYFRKLLQAFAELRTQNPQALTRCRLDFYVTGHDTLWYEELAAQQGLDGTIRFHAPLAPKEVFRIIRAANLVILYIPEVNKDLLGTKFQEIFYCGTPILHVGPPGLVSRTIRERRMGDSLRVEELVAELPRIIAGERKVECDPKADHSAYLLAPLTDRLIAEVLV